MPDQDDGVYWPNIFALSLFQAMQQALGKAELSTLLTLAQLEQYLDSYPPSDLARAIDFADISALRFALDNKYGRRGGHAVALLVGRHMYLNLLRHFFSPIGFSEWGTIPPHMIPRLVLPAVAYMFSNFSDQVSAATDENDYLTFTLVKCPFCWQRRAATPMCQIAQGILHDAVTRFTRKHLSGDRVGRYHFRIQIATCIAKGDDIGRLIVYKMPVDILD